MIWIILTGISSAHKINTAYDCYRLIKVRAFVMKIFIKKYVSWIDYLFILSIIIFAGSTFATDWNYLDDLRPQDTEQSHKKSKKSSENQVTNISYVVVDQRGSGYITFQGIPKTTSSTDIQNIRKRAAKLGKNVSMISWDAFSTSIDQYLRDTILINDYPKYDQKRAIKCLLGAAPGSPWGVTWNGGIAFTNMDYQHVQKTYERYKKSPKEYRPIKDPRRDPVNPGGFLPFFGCSQ
jgi:hypothetical protein